MPDEEIQIREMTVDDLPAGSELCRAARWNQLDRDWRQFLTLSPRGCRVAMRGDRVIGTVTTIDYEDRFRWVGMVLVDPRERRRGIGTRLLREAIEMPRGQAAIRLDATPAGREVYLKLGFVDEYGLSRMEARVSERIAGEEVGNARRMTEADLSAICEADATVFGADRRAMLRWMWEGAPEFAWVMPGERGVAGYCFGRRGFNFDHLGPIIAADARMARRLATACLRERVGAPFILDAFRHDQGWLQWLAEMAFREQRPFIRMFLGEHRHPGQPERQFAMLGPEFG
ncbi:MAG: GNAT family N-acetyltransferase [Blastocatellia bacterium]|nr:GNAT family N-acetyltransferase [Blastocatellia bacterium]